MTDFITRGADELPPRTDNSGARTASQWNVGDTNDILDALMDLRTAGTGWEDLQGPASIATAGLSAPTTEAFGDTAYPGMFFRHDQDDDAWWTFQTSHRWKRTTNLYLHVHYVPMADPSVDQVVRLSGQYAWAHYGQLIPAAADWTAIPAKSFTISPGALRKPGIAALVTIPPGTALESDFLMVQIKRPGSTDSADTYTTSKPGSGTAAANFCVLGVDCHYFVEKSGGTVNEIPSP